MVSPYSRIELARLIVDKLTQKSTELFEEFKNNAPIQSCYIDNLLPEEIVQAIYQAFPSAEEMQEHKSIRENKRVAAQMNLYNPLLEEIVFAFQEPEVVSIVSKITELKGMEPDPELYAGGISLMAPGNFLNPHLDNSHDHNQERYRVLNLLYYVSPDWKLENGGNLELWDHGVKGTPRTIVSQCNRLALMITHQNSYHSVSKVTADRNRCCVSNYYFSTTPINNQPYFHVTSFYGRPEEKLKNVLLKLDRVSRQAIRQVIGKRIVDTKHIYKKDEE